MTLLDLYDHKLALIEENAQRLGLVDKVKTQKWMLVRYIKSSPLIVLTRY